MLENLIGSADAVSRFCRLQMIVKRELPVRASEMGVLIFLQKSQEPVTPLMISSFFGISKPSVTDMVNALVRRNYLIKTPSQIDKRSYYLNITPKGHELVESTSKEYLKTIGLLQEKLGRQDFCLLIQLIQKANIILSEEV